MISQVTVNALLGVAPTVHPMLRPLMALMDATGRRLSSVLGLRWDDIDFEQQTIRWRPELDKRRRTWVTPLPREVEPVLQRCRVDCPAIGNALLFPSPKDPAKPVSIYLARSWLLRAYERAGIKREPGGLWHPFRRKWATQRKEYPLRDVAAAGGWSDVQTLLTCYQQPDPETLRAVVDGKKLTQKLTQPKRQQKSHSS
jgi:integrase